MLFRQAVYYSDGQHEWKLVGTPSGPGGGPPAADPSYVVPPQADSYELFIDNVSLASFTLNGLICLYYLVTAALTENTLTQT